jgi:hypothetical protein
VSPVEESALEAQVWEELIRHVHSRDLSSGVDFLKGVTITDENLLNVFWGIVQKAIHPHRLRALTLERDSRTSYTLSEENA